MNQAQTKFTVFYDSASTYLTSANPIRPQTLEDLIADAASDGSTPTRWAPAAPDYWGGTHTEEQLFEESAGRLIELVDGKYVPRGVDGNGGGSSCITKTPTLDKLANTAEPKRPALTWADTKPFDPFKGAFADWSGTGSTHVQPSVKPHPLQHDGQSVDHLPSARHQLRG